MRAACDHSSRIDVSTLASATGRLVKETVGFLAFITRSGAMVEMAAQAALRSTEGQAPWWYAFRSKAGCLAVSDSHRPTRGLPPRQKLRSPPCDTPLVNMIVTHIERGFQFPLDDVTHATLCFVHQAIKVFTQ